MTKHEMKKIINKAIGECDLNGHKWSFDGEKLHWNYLTVEYFTFEIVTDEDFIIGKVNYHQPHFDLVSMFECVFIGNGIVDDCNTIEEAIYLLTKKTINKANYIF
jgi:hypothetical protein